MSGEPSQSASDRPRPSHLRLVWKNPCPPPPRGPIDLAAAIERHLSGHDGLSDQEFLRLFSQRHVIARPAWAEAAAIV